MPLTQGDVRHAIGVIGVLRSVRSFSVPGFASMPRLAKSRTVNVGCAGWSLSRAVQPRFPAEGTHLERYAAVLPAVEINSSFYRPHRGITYRRWAQSVPAAFRFSLKLPKTITHERRLVGTEVLLDAFLGDATALGNKLGCVLIQLPPSLRFDGGITESFLAALRVRFAGDVALEPRHASWFEGSADRLLASMRVGRVAADPLPAPDAAEPGGDPTVVYYRLHGSPRIYYSGYDAEYLDDLAARLLAHVGPRSNVWCIFDNTALGAAIENALGLRTRLAAPSSRSAAQRDAIRNRA